MNGLNGLELLNGSQVHVAPARGALLPEGRSFGDILDYPITLDSTF